MKHQYYYSVFQEDGTEVQSKRYPNRELMLHAANWWLVRGAKVRLYGPPTRMRGQTEQMGVLPLIGEIPIVSTPFVFQMGSVWNVEVLCSSGIQRFQSEESANRCARSLMRRAA